MVKGVQIFFQMPFQTAKKNVENASVHKQNGNVLPRVGGLSQ